MIKCFSRFNLKSYNGLSSTNRVQVSVGVKALGQQKSIIKGRHPQSFRKESDLWHFTKASNERYERILRGYSFWDVIDDSVNIAYTDKEKKVLNYHEAMSSWYPWTVPHLQMTAIPTDLPTVTIAGFSLRTTGVFQSFTVSASASLSTCSNDGMHNQSLILVIHGLF